MSEETNWLIATAIMGGVSFALYLTGVVKRRKPFDLNMIVPLLLSCAASVAAVKMMLLAFSLPREIAGKDIASLFDAGSILVGGFVFFVTSVYGVLKIILDAFTQNVSQTEGESDESDD